MDSQISYPAQKDFIPSSLLKELRHAGLDFSIKSSENYVDWKNPPEQTLYLPPIRENDCVKPHQIEERDSESAFLPVEFSYQDQNINFKTRLANLVESQILAYMGAGVAPNCVREYRVYLCINGFYVPAGCYVEGGQATTTAEQSKINALLKDLNCQRFYISDTSSSYTNLLAFLNQNVTERAYMFQDATFILNTGYGADFDVVMNQINPAYDNTNILTATATYKQIYRYVKAKLGIEFTNQALVSVADSKAGGKAGGKSSASGGFQQRDGYYVTFYNLYTLLVPNFCFVNIALSDKLWLDFPSTNDKLVLLQPKESADPNMALLQQQIASLPIVGTEAQKTAQLGLNRIVYIYPLFGNIQYPENNPQVKPWHGQKEEIIRWAERQGYIVKKLPDRLDKTENNNPADFWKEKMSDVGYHITDAWNKFDEFNQGIGQESHEHLIDPLQEAYNKYKPKSWRQWND